jgi:hypothetical protein
MHRQMRDQVEQVLAGKVDAGSQTHLAECGECRDAIASMQEQAELLRGLRAGTLYSASEAEPRAGFYARVMERIEAQGAESIWSLFFDSPLGRRVAMASMALAVCLSVYLVSSEQMAHRGAAPEPTGRAAMFSGDPGFAPGFIADVAPDQDTVLVNLVTYRGQ